MRFFPAEPDIATVFNRIEANDIDLQPDFQRGEVWPVTKQQRLIDTILRGWVVPPILLVSSGPGHRQQVLDGQQRLAAIRDFKRNKFPVDGRIEPHDASIQQLNGLKYEGLPPDIAKSFDRTTLRLYEVADYKPEEPAEIFFRLNQPTMLTSAEKRNAFFGPVRDQIRSLVEYFESDGETPGLLGFSNSRMAYDDVFARFACALENRTLRKKITAASVNEMYRRSAPLSNQVYSRLRSSISVAKFVLNSGQAKSDLHPSNSKLNKATFFSWLIFYARLTASVDVKVLSQFMVTFELSRAYPDSASVPSSLLFAYTDRATSRVADVSSVLMRDFALWAVWRKFYGESNTICSDPAYARIDEYLTAEIRFHNEQSAVSFLDYVTWGEGL